MGGDIYRTGPNLIMKICIREDEMHEILKANHDGPCGGHFFDKRTTYKVLHLGYYWPTLFRDAKKYVRSCDSCQRMGMPVCHFNHSYWLSHLRGGPYILWSLSLPCMGRKGIFWFPLTMLQNGWKLNPFRELLSRWWWISYMKTSLPSSEYLEKLSRIKVHNLIQSLFCPWLNNIRLNIGCLHLIILKTTNRWSQQIRCWKIS